MYDETARECPVPDFTDADAGKLSVAFGKLTRNGTQGRVYGGDPNLIHAADGTRAGMGRELAERLSLEMRADALARGDRTIEQASEQAICPGCYMVIGFNMLRELALQNGQSWAELGRTMAAAFGKLTEDGVDVESIDVLLDPAG